MAKRWELENGFYFIQILCWFERDFHFLTTNSSLKIILRCYDISTKLSELWIAKLNATYLWKYSADVLETTSWIEPRALTSSFFTSFVHSISKSTRKCLATNTRASLGHGWYQSIVHPDTSAGNLRARFRNFSPTCRENKDSIFFRSI